MNNKNKKAVPLENQTLQTNTTNTGDVVFWQEWGKEALQTISIYYGPELAKDHRGSLPVNVFEQAPQSQWKNIEAIGLRIWQQGIERGVEIREKPIVSQIPFQQCTAIVQKYLGQLQIVNLNVITRKEDGEGSLSVDQPKVNFELWGEGMATAIV